MTNVQQTGSIDLKSSNGVKSYAAAGIADAERVVGTVNWIAEHGEYVNQAGEQLDPTKVYYTRSGTAPDYVYTVVAEPVAADIASYYVLRIDESVQSYIASHVALTNDGLTLTTNDSSYRAVLSSKGLEIISPNGDRVGRHGETIQLGAQSGIYFEASSTRLAFRTVSEEIAWFGLNSDGIWEMHISTTHAEDMIRFGNYAWIKRENGNMTIKWLGA